MAHFAQINSDDNIVIKVVVMNDAECAANGGVDSDQKKKMMNGLQTHIMMETILKTHM